MLVLKNISELRTPLGTLAAKGGQMDDICILKDACVAIDGDTIAYVGQNKQFSNAQVVDCSGKTVLPAFVDSHTHLVFGGFRPQEFMWRQQGKSYMDIYNQGGGIAASVAATRQASQQQLLDTATARLSRMAAMGIGTVEIKSGYGLDKETELKQLKVINQLKSESNLDICATYMGAHSIPKSGFASADQYISFMQEQMLPLIKNQDLAEFVDIFCEKGVFSAQQAQQLLSSAKKLGFKLKIHADEIVCTQGAQLAAQIGCTSADHLLAVDKKGIADLAASNTVATLLPLTAFCLKEDFAPARQLIDSGAAVALATDFNPGSCFSYSVPLLIALAVVYMRMTINEVITALTLNGACALFMGEKIGTIQAGKQADLIILDCPCAEFLAYHTGINCVEKLIKKGVII